jgi:hypothetical protein
MSSPITTNTAQRAAASLANATGNAAMAADIATTIGTDLAIKGYDTAPRREVCKTLPGPSPGRPP